MTNHQAIHVPPVISRKFGCDLRRVRTWALERPDGRVTGDDHCAKGLGAGFEAAGLIRTAHHGLGVDVEHVRVPWSFQRTSYRTSGYVAYRFYVLDAGAWDPYVGLGLGVGASRDYLLGCVQDVSGPAYQISAGLRWVPSKSIRVGARATFGGAGYGMSCDTSGADTTSLQAFDHPVRGSVGIGLELAWVALSRSGIE